MLARCSATERDSLTTTMPRFYRRRCTPELAQGPRTFVPTYFRICGAKVQIMPQFRIGEAASLLGVSDDTVRRWVTNGLLPVSHDDAGRQVIDGSALAAKAVDDAAIPTDPTGIGSSARNRFTGLVTRITSDTVMSQVELQCGPHRVVSLMSSEAVRDLGLEVGSLAVASIKATTVVIETPKDKS